MKEIKSETWYKLVHYVGFVTHTSAILIWNYATAVALVTGLKGVHTNGIKSIFSLPPADVVSLLRFLASFFQTKLTTELLY